MSLFQLGQFKLHSGGATPWRINCELLTPEDWDTIAFLGSKIIGPFSGISGVQSGGEALAKAMSKYITSGPVLICDDVLTTGKSMEDRRDQLRSFNAIGLVAFARNPCPDWVKAVWETRTNSLSHTE